MANRSENGQSDIVDQAEDVVRAYIERYFKCDKKTAAKKNAADFLETRLLITIAAISTILVALITLLFVWF